MQPIFPKEKRLQEEYVILEPGPPPQKAELSAPIVLSWKQHLFAGGLSRGMAVTTMFPIDVVKTRLQANGTLSLAQAFRPPYFAGYNAALCSQIPYGMAVFGTYENLKGALAARFPEQPRMLVFFVSAAAGDLAGSLVLTPGEVVKQKVQAGQHATVLAAVQSILRERGVKGFYQGYTGLVARDLPFRAIQLPLYETLKSAFANRFCDGSPDCISPPAAAMLGAGAGMVAAAATTPVDVIKTQMMCGAGNESVPGVVARLLRTDGPKAFFNGLAQRVGFLGGSSAVFFIVYEFVRGTLTGGITISPL